MNDERDLDHFVQICAMATYSHSIPNFFGIIQHWTFTSCEQQKVEREINIINGCNDVKNVLFLNINSDSECPSNYTNS